VREAVASLEGTGIPVAAVATGFPSGQTPLEQRLAEITAAVAAGASEIDVVVSRPLVLTGNWPELYKCAIMIFVRARCFFPIYASLNSSQGD
jgi:deoxyribose-phosphate aldolase